MTTTILTAIGILLAAAAALMSIHYGGDAFNGGAAKARAVTAVGIVQQVSYAAQMLKVTEGISVRTRTRYRTSTGSDNLLTKGYLTSVPNNPTTTSGVSLPFFTDLDGGYYLADGVTETEGRIAVMRIATDEEAICRVVMDRRDQAPATVLQDAAEIRTKMPGRVGCFVVRTPNGAAMTGGLTNNYYYVYARV